MNKLLSLILLLSAFTSAQTRTITKTNCSVKKLGASIATAAIGEPVPQSRLAHQSGTQQKQG